MRKCFKPVSLLLGVFIAFSMLMGIFTTSPIIGASSASVDYSCGNITVTRGQITTGSAVSLNLKDSSYLVIKSISSSRYNYVDWIAEFTLASRQVSSLNLSFAGRYTAYRGQYIYLFNYSTASWQRVDYRNIGAALVSFNLSSIANPASFVSSTGQVQVRVYSFSTAAYSGYTDLLKISATYNDAITAPAPAPAPVAPAPKPSPILAPPSASLRSGDYISTGVDVTRGKVDSGNSASLKLKDSSYLVIKSIKSSGYNYVDWISEFTLPSRQVKSLGLSFTGRYSTYRGQYIYLYNYTTANWQRIDYRNVGAALVNINLSAIANPASFVSSTGQVQVRIYSFSSAGAYNGYTDLLKLSVAY